MKKKQDTPSGDGDSKRVSGESGTTAGEDRPSLEGLMPAQPGAGSLKALISLVEVELEALARRMRRGFSPPPSLETAELVGEMYLRLFNGKVPEVCDRQHFFSIAACTMRWILVGRHRELRPEVLEDLMPTIGEEAASFDLEALHCALEELSSAKPEWARLVDMTYFLGLAPKEIAEIVQSSERTVYRDLKRARSWLYWRLGEEGNRMGAPS